MMTRRFLTAEIYRDAYSPELSIEPAIYGIDIVKSIAPWIKVNRQEKIAFDNNATGPIDVDEAFWPDSDADIAIVLTRRDLHNVVSNDHMLGQTARLDFIGVTMTWLKPRYRQIVAVNTGGIKRPEHIVAHEIGHVLGVESKNGPVETHCPDKKCLMYPLHFPFGRADRKFCDCCSEQLHDNSLTLRKAKPGRFAMRNSKISQSFM